MVWIILSIVAVISLVVFYRGPNAVWGAGTLGLIVGLIVALIQGFQWLTVWKFVASGIIVGTIFEILPKLSKWRR